jgi:hypothetical protein
MLASDEVAVRFLTAQFLTVPAVALVASGVVFLALAPKPKAEAAAVTPTLVTLKLFPTGVKALGCDAPSLTGIRIGGTDDAPLVITFPTAKCEARTVTFTTAKPEPLGTVTPAKTVTAPATTTTGP